jgi:PAS domain-containing protein
MVFGLSRSEKKAGELEEEHARLVSAIESVPIGLLITDTRGNIVLANYELTRILGNPEGGAWTLAKIDAQLGSVYSVMGTYNEVLLKKRTQTKNQVLFDSRHLDIYMAPIFSEPQGILGVLILVRDVTGL